jgi:hypothetical protein
VKTPRTSELADGCTWQLIGSVHNGKSGTVRDLKVSKTGAVTISVIQADGDRFKMLAKNVEVVNATR